MYVKSYIPLIFNALIDIGSKVDNAINLNNEANETLASTVDTQQICKLQNDKGRRTKVKIDVLKVKASKNGKETMEESIAVIDQLLDDLEISDQCEVTDAWRIPNKKPNFQQKSASSGDIETF